LKNIFCLVKTNHLQQHSKFILGFVLGNTDDACLAISFNYTVNPSDQVDFQTTSYNKFVFIKVTFKTLVGYPALSCLAMMLN
jgi:hypothetical protein